MHRTLLLNSTYEPLTVIDWRKAMTLLFLQKVEALAHYDRDIRGGTHTMALPAVVRLNRRAPWRKPAVRFNRKHVFARDNFTCQYCGIHQTASELTLDHVLPRSQGGPTCWTNIVTSCEVCNQFKGDRTPEQAQMALRSQPYAPYWLPYPKHEGKLPEGKHAEHRADVRAQEQIDTPLMWRPYLW